MLLSNRLIICNTIIFCFFIFQHQIIYANVCNNKVVKILSINGGGVRGIIPIKVLAEIEKRLHGKRIAESFDIMTGSSTGGIITLLLNVPNDEGKPKYSAQEVASLYEKFSAKIFNQSSLSTILSLNGWIKAKYSHKQLEMQAQEYFQDIKISQSISYVLIPAYDILNDKTEIFNKSQSFKDSRQDFYMRDVVLAASAAPTYFKPVKLQGKVLVDGGLTLNNPVLASLIHAFLLYDTDNVSYFIVSLGTGDIKDNLGKGCHNKIKNLGKLGWIKHLIDISIDGVGDLNSKQVNFVLEKLNSKRKKQYQSKCENKHIYLDIEIDSKHSKLDDSSKKNIKALSIYADQLIRSNESKLKEIEEVLNNSMTPSCSP